MLNVNTILSRQEIKDLLVKSDLKAAWEVASTWLMLALAFGLVYVHPTWYTVFIAWILVGARQLALAILMHDMSHGGMFKTKWLNNWVGNWLCGYPIFHNADAYRTYHLDHHKFTGTEKDPDILLKKGYPTAKFSMMRKLGRDLSGLSGIKAHAAILLMHLGYMQYSLGGLAIWYSKEGKRWWHYVRTGGINLAGPIVTNLVLFGIFWAIGMPLLYVLWIVSMLTTGMLFTRIRSIAEHGMTPDTEDALQNTRTTKANWWQKLLFAPHNVHYHLEHHMLMTVPSYNLPSMHKLLQEKGALENACVAENYQEVFRAAVVLAE